jgi:hypothetical protein
MSTVRIIILCILTATFLLSCHKTTEEDRVGKVLAEVQKAAEEKQIRTILGHLSKTYRDPQGRDYEGIKGLLAYYFFRHQKVSVYLADLAVTVQNSSAHAAFQAVLTGRGPEASAVNVLPEALGVYAFDVTFTKEEGEWMVISAAWTRIGDAPSP